MTRLFVGYSENQAERAFLTRAERALNVHVIGSPGTGKSKLLEHFIRQDIENGNGLCLIDPHGTLFANVLAWCAYTRPMLPVIALDPSAGDRIIGFNPFVGGQGDPATQVEHRIEATVRAWGVQNTDETPTLERWLRCIFHALIEGEGLTLAEAEYLISFPEQQVRAYLAGQIKTDIIRREWEELGALRSAREFRDEILSTKNRLMRFLPSRTVVRFMGLTDGNLNLRELMDNGAVLLVNLAKSPRLSRMNGRLFGSLLVNEFFEAALEREPASRPFFLYLDEFQNFVSHDIATMLEESRKFGLHAVLAHQNLAQLEEESPRVRAAVMGAARTKIVFGGLGRNDAAAMADEMFAGQVDYKEVKRVLRAAQFWPVYGREKIYGQAQGSVEGSGWACGSSVAHASGAQVVTGSGFGASAPMIFESAAEADMNLQSGMTAHSKSASLIDVPIFMPERHDVVTDEKLYTLEEQLRRLADTLMLQFQRHCFFKRPDGSTRPILVPQVREYPLPAQSVVAYIDEVSARADALAPQEVDARIEARRSRIEDAARQFVAVGHRGTIKSITAYADQPIITHGSRRKRQRQS